MTDIKAGDRVRLTFTDAEDAEHIITGVVYNGEWKGTLKVGSVYLHQGTVELLAPAWHDALVIQVAGRTFGKAYQRPSVARDRWMYVNAPEDVEEVWLLPSEVAALGEVRVVVGAEGNVVV